MCLLSRLPEREREKERERPPPRDLLKEARERREAARKEAERAAREKREADARQPPARHALAAPREPARRPDDRERQQDRYACAVHDAYATIALRQESFSHRIYLLDVSSLTNANKDPEGLLTGLNFRSGSALPMAWCTWCLIVAHKWAQRDVCNRVGGSTLELRRCHRQAGKHLSCILTGTLQSLQHPGELQCFVMSPPIPVSAM